MSSEQEFEKPVIELRQKITDLRTFAQERDLDLSSEIKKMEHRLAELEETVYGNLQHGNVFRSLVITNVQLLWIMWKPFLMIS